MEKFPTNEPTPEQKAELQQSRTLSDAELIKNGAQYAPDSNGEPVLNVDVEKGKTAVMVERESPESQKLIKLINKLRPVRGNSAMMGSSVSNDEFSMMYHYYGRNNEEAKERGDDSSPGEEILKIVEKKEKGVEVYSTTVVYFRDNANRIPRIVIKRSRTTETDTRPGYCRRDEENVSLTECSSLQEFYDNLKPEEKAEGEELGKKLESHMEDK